MSYIFKKKKMLLLYCDIYLNAGLFIARAVLLFLFYSFLFNNFISNITEQKNLVELLVVV